MYRYDDSAHKFKIVYKPQTPSADYKLSFTRCNRSIIGDTITFRIVNSGPDNMPTIPSTSRILSVQSHVVSGYCGNKSAVFPLQLLEFEVDYINSVQLSNHTQYKTTRGQIYESKDLVEIQAGLRANKLLKLYDIILSGYVADVSYIESLGNLVREVKQERELSLKPCRYTLDPVLGDDGVGYYVPNGSNVAGYYKKHLLPLADIVTPNRFEASVLSGVEIDTTSDQALSQAMQAIDVFHKEYNIQVVVITSLEIDSERGKLICILSHDPKATTGNGDNLKDVWTIRVPKLDCPFTGTGDLFTALLSGWLHKTQFNLRESLENTANSIHEVLVDTLAYFNQVNDGSVQSHELRLVQNKDKILRPAKLFRAEKYATLAD